MPHHQTPNTAIPTKTHTEPPKTHQAVTSQVALLEDDPFQQAGYIAERIPREWNPVIGVLS